MGARGTTSPSPSSVPFVFVCKAFKILSKGGWGKGDNEPKPTVPREEGFLDNIKMTIFIGITKAKL